MSYVRFDDAHEDGQLTAFRERLAGEIRIQTGREFPIFQDRNDIAWGQNWQQRIEEALDEVTFLLVIVTPGLFQSPECRHEVAQFREREQTLGRTDLILPVYYVSAREIDDPGLREADDLASLLCERQYADWRELRFEPLTSPVVRKTLAQLASRIRDSFSQEAANRPAQPGPSPQPAGSQAARSAVSASGIVPRQDTARIEPPTHVVDPYLRGDFATVNAAIEAAQPGDRILVRPGLYEESLMVDKPLEIIGDGPLEDIEIRAGDAHVLHFRASIGRVVNLTLRQVGSELGVGIFQGRLDLEGCDISSHGGSCVYIGGGADPRLRRNKIHGGADHGVVIYGGGLGTLEDNEITGNLDAGVTITTGGNPMLRRNQIHDNKHAGVYVTDGGLGTVEDNEISTNSGVAGVVIDTSGSPVLRRNQIRDNELDGVAVSHGGKGTLEDNEITGNAHSGVSVMLEGNLTARGNRINRNGEVAVDVFDGGYVVVEDNDLTGNSEGAWAVDEDLEPNFTRARNKE
jgi:F-box protein 11